MAFFGNKFLTFLEEKKLSYITAVKINPLLKQDILNVKEWLSIDKGIEVGELLYKTYSWKMPRRIIVVRQSMIKRPKAVGKTLFNLPDYHFYRFQLYVTNLDLPQEAGL